MKKKMCKTDILEPKKATWAKQAKIKEAARDQVLQNLKTSLSQKRALDTSSEDGSPQRVQHVNRPKAARRVPLPLASSPNLLSSDDFTYIDSPQRSDIIQESDSDEDLGLSSTQKPASTSSTQKLQQMDDNTGHSIDDIMASLRELPEMIKQMKECVEYVRAMMPLANRTPSSVMSSSSFTVDNKIEMHTLAGSTVAVSKRAFLRLNRSRMTLFCQELAALVFTKEVLALSTLTGKSGNVGTPKRQLDVAKVQAITDAVIQEFPQTRASDVQAAIRRKCNNEQFNRKK